MDKLEEKILNFLKDEISSFSCFDSCSVELDSELKELGLDSLDLVEIAIDLEYNFRLHDEISDVEISKCKTVKDLLMTVIKHIERK